MSKRTGIYVRVSTDDQRDNGYSIDSQLRMIQEYCEKNEYDIISVYNDAGYSGKDLFRPEMKRLIEDIKSKKLDKLVAIKVDRLTRSNLDGFWLLKLCEDYDVKIELILEPYDVSTANGEMIFGMNLVFGQRERKEIGARTKRAMEEMVLEKVHPTGAPYGYIRNKETGHLEIEPIEANIVKEIFELSKKGKSIRNISFIMKEKDAYLNRGKWTEGRIYQMLNNSIYIGIFEYGKTNRKNEDVLKVENYCEPIVDEKTWKQTRKVLEKNKHSNFGQHVHLFTSLVKCPECGKIMSSTLSYKYDKYREKHEYYHVMCKNINCKNKGLHYSSDKIENKLKNVLNELTNYMFDNNDEIFVTNTNDNNEIKLIDKAIEKLKIQEKRLVDLYLNSNLNVEDINQKNEKIKKELEKLNLKRQQLDPNNLSKEQTIDLLSKLNNNKNKYYLLHKLGFNYLWNNLNRKTKKEIINKFISIIEVKRDNKYNVEIKNIVFTDELLSKNNEEYLTYLNDILLNNEDRIKQKDEINEEELNELKEKYDIYFIKKLNLFTKSEFKNYIKMIKNNFKIDEIIECSYVKNNKKIDDLVLIPKEILLNI